MRGLKKLIRDLKIWIYLHMEYDVVKVYNNYYGFSKKFEKTFRIPRYCTAEMRGTDTIITSKSFLKYWAEQLQGKEFGFLFKKIYDWWRVDLGKWERKYIFCGIPIYTYSIRIFPENKVKRITKLKIYKNPHYVNYPHTAEPM